MAMMVPAPRAESRDTCTGGRAICLWAALPVDRQYLGYSGRKYKCGGQPPRAVLDKRPSGSDEFYEKHRA